MIRVNGHRILITLPTLLLLLLLLPVSCQKNEAMVIHREEVTALEKVVRDGKLDVIASYNSTDYFFYRGTPMGFTYEILKNYADHLGVDLIVHLNDSLEGSYLHLDKGSIDIVAIDQPVNQEKLSQYCFTEPIIRSTPVLVQRKTATNPGTGSQRESLVRDLKNLNLKTVYMPKGSPLLKLMTVISFETEDSINLVEHPEYHADQLISAVARDEIPYTVAYDYVAEVNHKFFPGLDVSTPLGPGQNLVWALSRKSEDLARDFNTWFRKFRKTGYFANLEQKYFNNPRTTSYVGSEYNLVKKGRISPFDKLIRKHSKAAGLDWRLVAAVIYYESKFHPEARAWSGAYGLMQLMPETAGLLGIDTMSTPDKQIEAGVKYIQSMDKQFLKLVPRPEERIKFVLAAYNVGIAHVLDARRLANKYGKDMTVWTGHVDSFLLNKSKPKYYQDRLSYYGYCRGEEPYNFVNNVLNLYELYKNAVKI